MWGDVKIDNDYMPEHAPLQCISAISPQALTTFQNGAPTLTANVWSRPFSPLPYTVR